MARQEYTYCSYSRTFRPKDAIVRGVPPSTSWDVFEDEPCSCPRCRAVKCSDYLIRITAKSGLLRVEAAKRHEAKILEVLTCSLLKWNAWYMCRGYDAVLGFLGLYWLIEGWSLLFTLLVVVVYPLLLLYALYCCTAGLTQLAWECIKVIGMSFGVLYPVFNRWGKKRWYCKKNCASCIALLAEEKEKLDVGEVVVLLMCIPLVGWALG